MRKIAVIGGGYLGAAFAYHAAQLGCEVSVFEQRRIAAGASGNSFACLNAFGHSDVGFIQFRIEAIGYLLSLAADLDATGFVHRSSTVRLASAATASKVLEHASRFRDAGGTLHELSAVDLRQLNSRINVDHLAQPAYRIENEGWLDMVAMTQRLLAHPLIAVHEAARVIPTASARGVGIVLEDQIFEFDAVVIAAGLNTKDLAAPFGTAIDLFAAPGVMLRITEANILAREIYYAPGVHFYSLPGGSLLAGIEDAKHHVPITPAEMSKRAGHCLSKLRQWIGDFRYSNAEPFVGVRPVPSDGYPVVGKLSNGLEIYALAAHGGATMGAILAAMLAEHIIRQSVHPWMLKFSPARFEQSHFDSNVSGGFRV